MPPMAASLPRVRGGIDFLGGFAAPENLGWGLVPFLFMPFFSCNYTFCHPCEGRDDGEKCILNGTLNHAGLCLVVIARRGSETLTAK
jgi:hypothetical protein